MVNVVIILLLLALGVGIIMLQIHLSKKEGKWAGLILPILSLLISIIVVLSFILFSTVGGTETIAVDGQIVEQGAMLADNSLSMWLAVPILFLWSNIPTAVLLAIYGVCRGKEKKRKDLEKMSVQDLG